VTAAFRYELGVASLAWPAPVQVTIEFDLLRLERRSGELTGEVKVRSTSEDAGLLHQARLNLTSTQSRRQLAQHLASRTGRDVDWPGLLEEACVRTLTAFREGEPALLLRDAPDIAATKLQMPPIGPDGDPWILFGDGESWKSYLGLAFAVAMHSGQPVLGMKPAVRRRYAIFDWEWHPGPHKDRMLRLWRGVGADPDDVPDILYVPCSLPLRDETERLQRIIRDYRIEAGVFDSVGYACDGPPEEAASALTFFAALRRLRIGALCIAHINRQGDTEKPFGSAFWHNSARQTWYVKGQRGDNSMRVGLFCKKSNAGPAPSPIGFEVTFDESATRVRRAGLHDIPEMAGQLVLKDRIAAALRSGPKSYVELAELLEVKSDVVRVTATRHEGKLFTRIHETPDGIHRVALLDRTHGPNTEPERSANSSDRTEENNRTEQPPLGGVRVFAPVREAVGI
jgi:hypothetical protein